MATLPTLSVVLPNYNHAGYLPAALDAILAQDLQPLEILVVDDGSTDNSVDIIEATAARAPHLRLLRNERNRGALHSINRGIDEARGDFVFVPAADDVVMPGLFRTVMTLLGQHPEASIGLVNLVFIVGDELVYRKERHNISPVAGYFGPDEFAQMLKRHCNDMVGTMFFRRTELLAIGKQPEELEWLADWWAGRVLALRHGLCYVPAPLMAFRILQSSWSSLGHRNARKQRELIRRMLTLLASSAFADVRPRFHRSGLLSHFGAHMVRVAIGEPRWIPYLSPWHVLSVMWAEMWSSFVQPGHPLLQWYRRLRHALGPA